MSRRRGVDEHHVEIAVGAQLAPPVPAHGDERDALWLRRRSPVLEQPGQPLVGGRENAAQKASPWRSGCASSSWRKERGETRATVAPWAWSRVRRSGGRGAPACDPGPA